MKANIPEKIYIPLKHLKDGDPLKSYLTTKYDGDIAIVYVRDDTFIKKARKWFEMQNEGVDSDGKYKCDMTDFEDFRNYMERE